MSLSTVSHLSSVVHDALLSKNASGNYFVSTLGVYAQVVAVLRNHQHMSEETLVEVERLLGAPRSEFDRIVAEFDRAIGELSEDTSFAATAWLSPDVSDLPAVKSFRDVSPEGMAQEGIPTQDVADAWVSEKSLGIIEKFPDVDPSALAILANVLATDIQWASNYTSVDAPESMQSWDVSKVLFSKGDQNGHGYSLVRETPDGPLLGVTVAMSGTGGMSVRSVIGDLPERELLRVAEAYVASPEKFFMVRLDDLVGTELPDWLTLEDVRAVGMERERYEGFLPAWDAEAKYELSKEKSLAAVDLAVVDGLLGAGHGDLPVSTIQVVKASYFAEGFKAAALTMTMIGRSAVFAPASTIQKATLSYRKPYAVVAVDTKAGLTVFSGMVRVATEA